MRMGMTTDNGKDCTGIGCSGVPGCQVGLRRSAPTYGKRWRIRGASRRCAIHKSTYFTLLLFLQYTTNFCWSCADAFLSESVCLTFDSTIDSLSCSSATLFCRSLSLSSATERASTRLACSASWRLIFLSLTWFWILKKTELERFR